MDRHARLSALGACLAFATCAGRAAAQPYPRLHVVALSQRADRASVAPGDVFHVTIHVKIAEQRDRLDDLILGSFDDCEIISNETVRTAGPGGTDFVERLAVQALNPGEAAIGPAFIDAVDPALGRPMRFSSNAVSVRVTGASALDGGLRDWADRLRRLLLAATIAVGLLAAVFVLGVLFVRGRRRRPHVAAAVAPAAPPIVEPAAAPGADPRARVRQAAAAYRSARTEAALAEVRAALFDVSGVGRGATLVDALRALGDRDEALRAALFAAERATFGPANERPVAGDALLAAIDAFAGAPAAERAWTR